MRTFFYAGMVMALALPVQAADIPMRSSPAPQPVAGQCHGYFGQPITDEMLTDLHDAGCCAVLQGMEETLAVNALERRLHCEGWHQYWEAYGVPPQDFDDLASGNPPPPPVAAPAAAPPVPVVPPAAPAEAVLPIAPAPDAAAPVVDQNGPPVPPIEPEGDPVEPPQDEWIVY